MWWSRSVAVALELYLNTRAGEPDRGQKSPRCAPGRTVSPVDQVGEPGLGSFVLGLDFQDLLGGFGRGLARAASAEFHLQRARYCHHGRPSHACEHSLAYIRGYVSDTRAHWLLLSGGLYLQFLIGRACRGLWEGCGRVCLSHESPR